MEFLLALVIIYLVAGFAALLWDMEVEHRKAELERSKSRHPAGKKSDID